MPINKIIIQKLLFVFTWVFLVTYCKCNTHVCVKKKKIILKVQLHLHSFVLEEIVGLKVRFPSKPEADASAVFLSPCFE